MLEKLYFDMLRIRRIEEAIAERYPEQQMRCPVHLSIGQEAVAVGVCSALEKTDLVVSGHRAHAHYLAKGGSFKKMLAEIYGLESGCSQGRGGSMHLVDLEHGFMGSTPIVGGTIPVGVGLAFADRLQSKNRVTTIFFGEGATEEGVWAESLNFAALHRLPILFVCENNLYSVYSPLSVRQALERDRVMMARSHGIEADKLDGNEVQAVFQRSKELLGKIREGLGPGFLEFSTYRFREHCGPEFDDHLNYRPPEEIQWWQERCPLAKVQVMETEIQQEITEAFESCGH